MKFTQEAAALQHDDTVRGVEPAIADVLALVSDRSLRGIRDDLQSSYDAIGAAALNVRREVGERQVQNCNPTVITELLCGDPLSRAHEREMLARLKGVSSAYISERVGLRREIALLNGRIAVEAGLAKGQRLQAPEV
ncbi:hypothetical protein IPP75_00560 [Candidatus Saccharibacteria bacterium]|nr:MAG: hypothetical protein IPP75_00560 [Candidatus Saccharibacteria bacterium]